MSTPERSTPEISQPSLPRAFGDFLLLHRLGRGGMGDVFLAKTGGIAGIEKLCVVKTLRGDLTADSEYKQRFIDEARVVVQLNHRNICHVSDVGRVDSAYYLAMEYVRGRDLRSIGKRAQQLGVPIPQDVVLYLVSEVLEALDYAHRLKDPMSGEPLHLVHRDVSPQNVMVNYEGEVKLIDFGLAQSTMKIERTAPRIVMGKLAYMPPEQARGLSVDGSVDQFAVGVMTYEAVMGRPFYEGKSADEVWRLAGFGGHRPPAFAELEPDLARILERSLASEPAERYPTCADMRQDLLRLNLSRGSMAGARELRALMEQLFAQDEREDRVLLQRFANVRPLDARPRGEEPVKEKTVRIATAVVKRSDVGLDAGEAKGPRTEKTAALSEDTETGSAPVPDAERTLLVRADATESAHAPDVASAAATQLDDERTELAARPRVEPTMVVRERVVTDPAVARLGNKKSRVPLLLGVGGLVVALAGASVWLLRVEEPPPPPPPSIRVVSKPVAATPAPPPVATEPPPAPVAPVEAPPEDATPPEAQPEQKPRAAAPRKPPKRKLITPLQHSEYLKRYCLRRAPCAARLVRRADSLASMSVPETQSFTAALRSCVEQCQR